MEKGPMKKVGVVLSGGGARGIAHLGVLQAFDELGVPIHRFSGTSSGAIVAAFYAAGYAPSVVLEILVKTKLGRLMRPAFSGGLLHMEPVERLCAEYLGDISFEDLQIPLVVAATDLNQGNTTYFSSGKLLPILIASSSVPVLYRPVRLGNHLLVDGGVLNNLPVEGILDQCDYKIGVHSNPVHHGAEVRTFRNIVERTFHLLINNSIQPKFQHLDLLVEPQPLKHYSMLSFSKAREFYEIGYTYTMELAETLLPLRAGFAPPVFNRSR